MPDPGQQQFTHDKYVVGGFATLLTLGAGRKLAGKKRFRTVLRRTACAIGTGSATGGFLVFIFQLAIPERDPSDTFYRATSVFGVIAGSVTYLADVALAKRGR